MIFNNNSKNSIIKKIIAPSIVYALVIAFFKIFIIDSPIITLVSIVIMFVYLGLENKFKMWKLSLIYSLFVGCLTECSHALLFKIVSLGRNALQIPEVTDVVDTKLIVFRTTIVFLYAIALLLIYIFKLIDIKTISKISNYKVVPIFLLLSLIVIIYSKYHIKYTFSDEFHNILSTVFVVFTIMFFTLSISVKVFVKIIDELQKKKLNPAIEEAKLRKGQHYTGMSFISDKFNFEMKYFKNELEKIGMDNQDHGSTQIVFATILLKYEEHPSNVALRSKIYYHISEILEILPTTVEANISNALKRHWNLADSKALAKIKENYDGPISEKNGAPTPKEFLVHLVKKAVEKEAKAPKKNKIIAQKSLIRANEIQSKC